MRRPEQIELIRALMLEKLAPENYFLLKYLMEFLNLISTYSETNKMTTKRLSSAFGSNLAWSEDATMNNLKNFHAIDKVTEILILRYTEIFLK